MKKKWTLPAIYILAVVILAIIIYVVPSLIGLLDVTYLAEYGDVKVEDTVEDAWIIRDDTVYEANKNAKIEAVVKDGTLIKGKGKVLSMEEGGSGSLSTKYMNLNSHLGDAMKISSGKAGRSGYVSFSADGNEGKLSSKTLDDLTEKELKKIGNDNKDISDNSCTKGQPLFRITKNGTWWIVFFADEESAKKYTEGNSIQTTVDDTTVTTKVRTVKKVEKKRYKIILSCKEYNSFYLTKRKISLTNVTENDTGLLVEVDSIVKINKKQGVLVKDKVGKLHFTRIKTIASNGEYASVYEDLFMDDNGNFVETISNYDEIIRSPSKKDIKEAKANL